MIVGSQQKTIVRINRINDKSYNSGKYNKLTMQPNLRAILKRQARKEVYDQLATKNLFEY